MADKVIGTVSGFGSGSGGGPGIGEVVTPAQAMRLAIREADKGTGFVSPNPLVGCTIVDADHKILSIGYHSRVGGDHAEIDALKKLKNAESIKGAHLYVTLEPCAHESRTPSCAKTLAPLGVASVTYAVQDPNPLVSGQGAAILCEAGVQTRLFSERADVSAEDKTAVTNEAEDLAEIFLHAYRHGEPFVAVKVASTLDGQMGLRSGESKWITGEASRERVHLLRARYDAVVIGRGTYTTDNPTLNVRHSRFPGFANKVVILDPKAKSLATLGRSNILKEHSPESVFVVVDEKTVVPSAVGEKIIRVPCATGFDMPSLLKACLESGLQSLMIEGGAATYGEFFKHGKVQRLHAFMAPSLLGGSEGLGWGSRFGFKKLEDKIQLQRPRIEILGGDIYITARL
jgi:diaminohydroxyphosphoribosylaminopyrimidine deaminase/5-amino-6-(5-phosphoribosylamino)uracil reductase